MANTGIGATIVFTGGVSSSLVARDIGPVVVNVDDLDDTSLASTGYMETVPDDLASIERVAVESFAENGTNWIGNLKTICTVTITYALAAGETTPAQIAGSGYIAQASEPQHSIGQRPMRNLEIKFDGKTGPTYTAST